MILKKIRYRLSLSGLRCMLGIGMANNLLADKKGSCILVFHGIDLKGNTTLNSRFLSVTQFETLVECIKQRYELVSLSDLHQKQSNRFRVAITFDDGLKNNLELALPVLKKYRAPATFFVNTLNHKQPLWPDFLDLVSSVSTKSRILFDEKWFIRSRNDFLYKGKSLKSYCKEIGYARINSLFQLFEEEWELVRQKADWDVYWKRLSPEDLRRLANEEGMEVGAHGVTHVNLTAIEESEAKKECVESKRMLEDVTGKKIRHFAFPFGSYTTNLLHEGLRHGYEQLYLVDPIPGERLLPETHGRLIVNPYLAVEEQLYFMLKGKYLS